MFKLEQNLLQVVTRRFWGTVFALIIAVAVVVQLGRQAFPLLKDYQLEVTQLMEKSLGVIIEVRDIEASWSGLRPKLTMKDVHVSSENGTSIFKVKNMTAELSLLNSLSRGRFAWRQLLFDGFEASLSQSADGHWTIAGVHDLRRNSPAKDELKFDDPYDLFLFGRRVKINNARFALHYLTGQESYVAVPNIFIENDRSFHRLQASIDLREGEGVFSLVVEGHGDPREQEFVANGYIELDRFSTQNIIEVLALKNVSLGEQGHTTSLKLWFRSDYQKGTTLRGEVHASGDIDVDGLVTQLPKQLQAQFHGRARREDGWNLTLQDLAVTWAEREMPPVTLSLYGDFRRFHGMRVKELDVEAWVAAALEAGIEDDLARKIVAQVNPRGLLKNLDVRLTDKASGYFQASARVERGMSDAFMGAPAFTNINGYASLNMNGGLMNVAVNDGFTIDLPKVYHEPLAFSAAQGQLRWHINYDKKIAYVSSGLVTLSNPEEQGKGYLHLTLPFSRDYGEPMMTLALGIKHTWAKNHKKYVPKTIPPHLYRWLGSSIKEGRITDAKFLYHGSVQPSPEVPPSIQLLGKVHDGNLVFDPSWPELEQVSGRLSLDNHQLDVNIDQASLLGNSVFDAAISLVDDAQGEGRALAVTGSLASDASSAMTLLKASPIKQHIGSTFDSWGISGGVAAKVELLIPLKAHSKGLRHKIEVSFSNASVAIPDVNIAMSEVKGKLFYQTEKGIYTDNLAATIWGHPFHGSIASPANEHGAHDTLVHFNGRADIDDLQRWTHRPELKFASGSAEVDGRIFIPGASSDAPLQVSAHSSLQGVAIRLPTPLGKAAEDVTDFATRIRFFPGEEEYGFRLGQQLDVTLLNSHSDGFSAQIDVNNSQAHSQLPSPIASTGRIDVYGQLQYFDVQQWNEVKEEYLSYVASESAPTGQAATSGAGLPVTFELAIDTFSLGSFEVASLQIEGQRQSGEWRLEIDSELMAGTVRVPQNSAPIRLDLTHLRFAKDQVEPELAKEQGEARDDSAPLRPSVLAGIDLSKAIALDFSTQEFSLGEANYGSWDFKVRPLEDGIEVSDIVASTRGMQLGDEDAGATFIWRQLGERQSSQFSGTIVADDLAEVFAAWEQEKLIYSESAQIDIDAAWPGAPDQVTLSTVQGIVGLDVQRGSFARGAGSDENTLLRLIALFNFDTILRRLRLDFSDLASQGYAFDQVSGKLDFRGGKVFLTEPLIVNSSSSYLQLAGTVDMMREELDAEMVVTLPMASNAAVATAVVVGLPAALGVYVMSKLFKKQVDRASTLNIDVSGAWADPKLKVKKIFDIDAASRRSQQLKEENFAHPEDPAKSVDPAHAEDDLPSQQDP